MFSKKISPHFEYEYVIIAEGFNPKVESGGKGRGFNHQLIAGC